MTALPVQKLLLSDEAIAFFALSSRRFWNIARDFSSQSPKLQFSNLFVGLSRRLSSAMRNTREFPIADSWTCMTDYSSLEASASMRSPPGGLIVSPKRSN